MGVTGSRYFQRNSGHSPAPAAIHADGDTFTSYNPGCRVRASTESVGGTPYPFGYSYNLAGELTGETYPSGRTIATSYDSAGRPNSLTGTLASVNTNYATNVTYAPQGAIAAMVFGNGLTESWQYNNRLQPTQMQAGGLLTLGFGYSPSQNNGNLASETIARAAQTWTQSFGYDSLNRLLTASESAGWSETYGYDTYGNRWLSDYSGLPAPTNETPRASTWYLANNRISGWDYDGRGNVKAVQNMPRAFTYDAENRQVTATVNSSGTTYAYDGEGRRITKNASGLITTYVYDAFGNLAAEYGGSNAYTGTQYVSVDHLGSTRLITDATGVAVQCHDFLPFGEEILSGNDSRGSCFPSAPSSGLGQNLIIRISRAGANGYQVIESVIDQAGGKQVVQKAYDAAGNLVHYDPK